MLSVAVRNHATRQRCFGLVELMVAMLVGLVVSAALLALAIAIIHSNLHTLQSTRLDQELHATPAVIANDSRRARAADAPMAVVPGGNPYRAVSTATAGCVAYAYDDATEVHGMPWTRPPTCARSARATEPGA